MLCNADKWIDIKNQRGKPRFFYWKMWRAKERKILCVEQKQTLLNAYFCIDMNNIKVYTQFN